MSASLSLPDKVVAIHEGLAGAKVEHAFGGALALAYYAEPQSTIDIDVNVFVSPEEHGRVEQALRPLGVAIDVDAVALRRDGQCRLWWESTPIDLFFSYDPIHDSMRTATRVQPFGDDELPILGPEHLIVCKATFNRPKDWIDVEQMLVCVDELDIDEIRGWLQRIVGHDDPRAERFEQLAAEV